ncbi:MAG TPA: hypothetical protein H9822_08140 [Candidatus Yaniella excrementavium]|nr:hypothetical protein [Candidatus Yaniella excrementavium]
MRTSASARKESRALRRLLDSTVVLHIEHNSWDSAQEYEEHGPAVHKFRPDEYIAGA